METLLERGYDIRPQSVKLCKDKGPTCVCRVSQSGDPYTIQTTVYRLQKRTTQSLLLSHVACASVNFKSLCTYFPSRTEKSRRSAEWPESTIDLQVSRGCGCCTVETVQVSVYYRLYHWTATHLVTSQALAICLGLVRTQEIASERKRGARIGETLWICPNRSSTEDLSAT
ncbi:hypothetical protein BDR22DRAFT_408830 [Usnea florida]